MTSFNLIFCLQLLCDEALQWTEGERLLEERISEKRKNPGNLLSGMYYVYSYLVKKPGIYFGFSSNVCRQEGGKSVR